MRMKKVASRLLYNSKWKEDNSYFRAFWTGEFEGKKVNYILIDDRVDKVNGIRGEIKYLWNSKLGRKNKVVIKNSDLTCVLDKNSGEITLDIKTWLSQQVVEEFLKRLLFYRKRYVGIGENGVYWLSVHDIYIRGDMDVLKLNMYYGYRDMISVYLYRGKNIIYLDNAMKNREMAMKTREKVLNMQEKQYKIMKKKVGKGRYSVSDLEMLGGIKVRKVKTFFASLLRKRQWKNTRLRIPRGSEIVIKEKGYDLAGSVVFKCIILVPRYPYVRQVFLIGKEYTGEWWMHSVPPEYWNRSLAECERWVLNLKDGDVVVSEA